MRFYASGHRFYWGGDGFAMLVAGPSTRNPDASYRIEFLRIDAAR